MGNKFYFIDTNYINDINIYNDTELNFFIFSNKNTNININLFLLKNINVHVNLFTISHKNISYKININSNFVCSNSLIKINSFNLATDESKINISINSKANENIYNSKIFQNIFGILLTDNCSILAEPKLDIQNNDIISTHSLKLGPIDKEELFYLMSKGFDYNQCVMIIIQNFIASVLNDMNEKNKKFYFKKIFNVIGNLENE